MPATIWFVGSVGSILAMSFADKSWKSSVTVGYASSGLPGSAVSVPVRLTAQGNENAVGFSISFPPALGYASAQLGSGAGDAILDVNADQATAGRLGIYLALSAGETFPSGTQELVVVTFQIAAGIGNTTAGISFGDVPLAREISDPLANSLRASYLGATVTITGGGYEGDVTPLPDGNGILTVTDWVKVGRYAANLDVDLSASQFQRADCAPRSTLGDGAIRITDWVQAGRYAAGLDPLTPAGGPTGPSAAAPLRAMQIRSPLSADSVREVTIPRTGLRTGQTNRIPVLLVAQGNESAIGFSLNFDASVAAFIRADAGINATGAVLNVNISGAATGRIGVALSLPIGKTFAVGTQEVAALRFAVASNAMGGTGANFGDQPVTREVSDALANSVAATFMDSALIVVPALRIRRAGADHVVAWPAWASNFVVESSQALPGAVWSFPPATSSNVVSGELRLTIPGSAPQRFFRLRLP